jgi:hypothetical protein
MQLVLLGVLALQNLLSWHQLLTCVVVCVCCCREVKMETSVTDYFHSDGYLAEVRNWAQPSSFRIAVLATSPYSWCCTSHVTVEAALLARM